MLMFKSSWTKTVSISILFPKTFCYETKVLIVDNFARLFRIMFYMPVS